MFVHFWQLFKNPWVKDFHINIFGKYRLFPLRWWSPFLLHFFFLLKLASRHMCMATVLLSIKTNTIHRIWWASIGPLTQRLVHPTARYIKFICPACPQCPQTLAGMHRYWQGGPHNCPRMRSIHHNQEWLQKRPAARPKVLTRWQWCSLPHHHRPTRPG